MLSKIKNKWQDILLFMMSEFDVTDISYTTWLKPLKPYRLIGDRLYITISEEKDLFKNYLEKKYKETMAIAIKQVTGSEKDIIPVFLLESEADTYFRKLEEDDGRSEEGHEGGDFTDLIRRNGLNPNFTFQSFVSGKSNELAHAASLAVAESPGEEFKLLYLYGGVGLGKTHLMHAIAIYILKNNPKARILYTTSEGFLNEYINAIRNNTAIDFRRKYRTVDVLLIDDIQFIAGRDQTQEEFFNTFNTLYNDNKQIIISSDKPPKDINNLEERIKSRFEGGMIVDIQPPNYETRMAILRKKAELGGYNVDDEIIKYIATNIKSNIRSLEGALSKVMLKSRLEKTPVDVESAAKIIDDFIDNTAVETLMPEKIISVVCEHYQIRESDILSQKKNNSISHIRQIIMYLCCEMTGLTLKEIGSAIGSRNHATVIHGREKIEAERRTDEKLKADLEILRKKLTP